MRIFLLRKGKYRIAWILMYIQQRKIQMTKYLRTSNLYQVVQINDKLEEVVFHDPLNYQAAYSLLCSLKANEKINPKGWNYWLEKKQD